MLKYFVHVVLKLYFDVMYYAFSMALGFGGRDRRDSGRRRDRDGRDHSRYGARHETMMNGSYHDYMREYQRHAAPMPMPMYGAPPMGAYGPMEPPASYTTYGGPRPYDMRPPMDMRQSSRMEKRVKI